MLLEWLEKTIKKYKWKFLIITEGVLQKHFEDNNIFVTSILERSHIAFFSKDLGTEFVYCVFL